MGYVACIQGIIDPGSESYAGGGLPGVQAVVSPGRRPVEDALCALSRRGKAEEGKRWTMGAQGHERAARGAAAVAGQCTRVGPALEFGPVQG